MITENSVDQSVNVINADNSVGRWQKAMDYYRTECSGETLSARTAGVVDFNCVFDVSGSMEGNKITATKLGMCAVIAQLDDSDVINISSFSDRCLSLTAGFQPVSRVRTQLPSLLNRVHANGSTSCYDSAIEGIEMLRRLQGSGSSGDVSKNVLILLTDGEDTCSRQSAAMVRRYLAGPGINSFMFVLVAVEMSMREERVFADWIELRHCKQMSVNVRTGSKLVKLFRENLMNRVLGSETDSDRFYQHDGSATFSASDAVGLTEAMLRAHVVDSRLLRDDGTGNNDYASPCCSRVASECGSDHGGDSDPDDDGNYSSNGLYLRRDITPPSSPGRGGYLSSLRSHIIVDEIDNGGLLFRPSSPALSLSMNLASHEEEALTPHPAAAAGSIQATSISVFQFDLPASMPADSESKVPAEFLCPITQAIMTDPVIATDGNTYERTAIVEWFRSNPVLVSPLTNEHLVSQNLIPNHNLRKLILDAVTKLAAATQAEARVSIPISPRSHLRPLDY